MPRRRNKQGFTLVELLTVVAIVVILAAVLLSVYARATSGAKDTDCTSRMHQLGLATELYAASNNDHLPVTLYEHYAVIAPYTSDLRVWQCPKDKPPYFFRHSPASRHIQTSYHPMPDIIDGFLEEISIKDPNYAIFICVLHGEQIGRGNSAVGDYIGTVKRLRVDTSVQRVKVPWKCHRSADGGVYEGRNLWYLFTDAKPSQAMLDQLVGAKGVTEIPCTSYPSPRK